MDIWCEIAANEETGARRLEPFALVAFLPMAVLFTDFAGEKNTNMPLRTAEWKRAFKVQQKQYERCHLRKRCNLRKRWHTFFGLPFCER